MKPVEESSPFPFLNGKTFNSSETETSLLLTWNEVSVTVPDKAHGRRQQRSILHKLTGYAGPGNVLAIMGPSGCGKSTLLNVLAGRLDSNTRQSGDILINGHKQTLAFGTSAYVTQEDTLMATLTTREAIYYSAQLQLPDSMSRTEKRTRAEETIREMGLQDAINTSVKGLSGGQKRRVSICIEILMRPKLLFLDEPTSGLDSAASYHVINYIAKLAKHNNISVVASIHQPSSEVFELFHNLCLLSSGRTVYFGTTTGANEFFASHGFVCPPMRNPSDHFLRTINQDFDLDIEHGVGGKGCAAQAIDILVKAYQTSDDYQHICRYVNEIHCQQNNNGLEKRRARARFSTQCHVLTQRSFVNMYRDLGYYWFRFAIYMALSLCLGTLYYDLDHSYSSIQARGSVLMFVSSFMTFMCIGGFPSFVEDMKIFSCERLNGHYSVVAFVVANTLSSIPYLILVSLVPATLAYYLIDLQRDIDHFAYYVVLLFTCMMLVESLMMVVSSIVPNYLTGIITGAGIQAIMILNGGFFRLPNDIPKAFWKYPMYYISFHKYANQGFYKNEFEGLTFLGKPGSVKKGEEILNNYWQMQMGYSKWVDLAIVFGMMVLYKLLFLGVIMGKEKFKPMIKAFMVKTKV